MMAPASSGDEKQAEGIYLSKDRQPFFPSDMDFFEEELLRDEKHKKNGYNITYFLFFKSLHSYHVQSKREIKHWVYIFDEL